MVEDNGVPVDDHRITSITGYFLTCPGKDLNPGSGERQRAVSVQIHDQCAVLLSIAFYFTFLFSHLL